MASPRSSAAPTSSPILDERWQALRINVTSRYERLALAKGEPIGHFRGILTTLEYATIYNDGSHLDLAPIDQMLSWYRQNGTSKAPILYWLHRDPPPARLDAQLLARGASPNWKPHWMSCNLGDIDTEQKGNSLLEIRLSTPQDLTASSNEDDRINGELIASYPDSVHHIVALNQGNRVGSCLLNLTSDEDAIAGLFDMWVEPEFRRQGVGTALSKKAFSITKNHGLHQMYLNATPEGEKLYSVIGFKPIETGFSWHLKAGFDTTESPNNQLVQVLEALLTGESRNLDNMITQVSIEVLQKQTANGMTPLELAVHAKKPSSAQSLLNHGVIPDLMSLWNLGWKDKIQNWVLRNAELVNQKGGEMMATPLHYAVQRNDVELADLVLSIKACDLTIKDGTFKSTAVEWAGHLDRPEVLRVIKKYRDASKSHC